MPPEEHLHQRSALEALRLLKAGRPADALAFAEQAVAGARGCLPAHGMLATILWQLGMPQDADNVVQEALKLDAGTPDSYDGLAHVSMLLGEHQRSNALYRKVVELAPACPQFWYNLASSERSFGRLEEAEAYCDRAIALDLNFHGAYLLRSELRVQTPERNHVEDLRERLSRGDLSDQSLIPLGYALGKELDDLQRFDEAFCWFARAASARRRRLAYDVSVDEGKLQRIQQVFRQCAPALKSGDRNSSRFIFIVGLPRSGTTLLEHMLTSLPGVWSNGETDNFATALMSATPAGPEDLFARAAAADPDAVADHYVRRACRRSGDARVLEKLPLNYLYLGAIRRALPDAKIIVVKREPLDSCFAMYRTFFMAAYPFSYDFSDLARYYAAYDRLMRHWHEVLGPALCEVEHAALVSDPCRVGERVAKHCGLRWVASAAEVHKSKAVSFTASAAQIRRPISARSSGHWRYYRAHLGSLIGHLRRCEVTLPQDA
jgi:tetratricopeptide (TPR) repeat protein